ncbi:MAG: RagB/SusD family nutrient uptake outer membrane protein [Bacteroidia bacterium]|nr:RagB/SusD family nutrient uptake outer membrane protein [Bacteroidia bacterium]
MKKIFKYTFAILLGLSLCSCDKLFDSVEGDLSKMSEDDMIATQASMERLLSDIYNTIPMDAFNKKERNTTLASNSRNANYSVDVTGFWNYTKMRSINLFIQKVDIALEKKVINEATRNAMLGEALFARAYCYFAMVRLYGGVPIVTEPLDQYYDGKENAGLYIPRSTEKETWDFVISELDKAIELLPESRNDGAYRATKWAALGLQSRVALYAASVSKYWSREAIPSQYLAVQQKLTYMEASYANEYYKKCIEASEKIMNSGKFSLYGGATTDVAKAKENLTNLFLERQDCEFIFGKSYKTGVATADHSFDILNSPFQGHATAQDRTSGNYSITSDLVDLYDDYDANGGRVDGTVKTRNDGKEDEYFAQISTAASNFDPDIDFIKYDDPADPFLNKDARFQAWVLYPGASFRNLIINAQAGFVKPDGSYVVYQNESCKVNGVTYYSAGAETEGDISAFIHIDEKDQNEKARFWNSCFGIRKFLDPNQAIVYSSNPWCDIRYAEILLNYAEAVAESGQGDAAKAKKVLNDIRHRAAFTDDIDLTVDNVCHERRVEFAMEGHESYTLHRRREYLNPRGGEQYRKHTLAMMLDLRGDSPKYIFPRVNLYHGDVQFASNGINTDQLDYYGDISNYVKNGLTPNPSQE